MDLVTEQAAATPEQARLTGHHFLPALRRACAQQPLDRFQRCVDVVQECRRLHDLALHDPDSATEHNERLCVAVLDPAHRLTAFNAIVIADPIEVAAFTGTLGQVDRAATAVLATSAPDGFRAAFDAVIDELPARSTTFAALDRIGDFLDHAADLDDAYYPTKALRWITEVGSEWNRFYLQKLAKSVARRLSITRLRVLRPALDGLPQAVIEYAVPDLLALPASARPRPQWP